MASKPKRRRHNKHNLSLINQGAEQVPKSRKAFKTIMRNDRLYQTKDIAKVKKALFSLGEGETIFLSARNLSLSDKRFQGYYTLKNGIQLKIKGGKNV